MKKNIYKWLLWVFFVLYSLVLLYVTFGNRNTLSGMSIADYFQRSINLVPFKTISLYIKWILDGDRTNNFIPLTNLGVNLILLFPMGFFLPNLIKICRNFFAYTGFNVLILVLIESIQLLTRRGSFDVDDFLLNLLGAVIGYVVWIITSTIINKVKDTKTGKEKT